MDTERWGVFELELTGPAEGNSFNPFTEVRLSATFSKGRRCLEAEGFYDGGGVYRIRFMPDEEGVWQFATRSNVPALHGIAGELACTRSSDDNHGPVRVRDATHFQYADGTRFTPLGTTLYVWHLQGDEMEEETLRTLASAPFNKVRMCVFPKRYPFNQTEPACYPFEGSLADGFDFARPNPAYFAHLERRIQDLLRLGIEADVILFHPYDEGHWGFDGMPAEADDRYVRYAVARLAAYRNVWWSLANEYDLLVHKTTADWDRLFRLIQETDYGAHLRSIHNCRALYDYGKPWITHASIQHGETRLISTWAQQYEKPVIVDECGYEGNLAARWGSLPAEELVCRMWEGNARGGYVTHGETYLHPEERLWWSHGGRLYGESVPRIAFLRRILAEAPEGLRYSQRDASTLEVSGDYYLQYFGPHRFSYREFLLPEGSYTVDVIDTWKMTIERLEGTFEGRFRIDLPLELYYALRIQRVEGGDRT
jgi:hypothetical protein